jgi:hypothetical protein
VETTPDYILCRCPANSIRSGRNGESSWVAVGHVRSEKGPLEPPTDMNARSSAPNFGKTCFLGGETWSTFDC